MCCGGNERVRLRTGAFANDGGGGRECRDFPTGTGGGGSLSHSTGDVDVGVGSGGKS